MIPSTQANKQEEVKAEAKVAEDPSQVKCTECSKKLVNKPQKNTISDHSIYMIKKREEDVYAPYCSLCCSGMEYRKIGQIETYDTYQKKLKAGLL